MCVCETYCCVMCIDLTSVKHPNTWDETVMIEQRWDCVQRVFRHTQGDTSTPQFFVVCMKRTNRAAIELSTLGTLSGSDTKLWIHIQSILRKMHRSHVKLWSEELGDARQEFRCVSVPAPHTWARWGWLQRLEIDLLEQRSHESLYVSGSLSGRRRYCT